MKRFSAHKIHDHKNLPISVTEYSRFKYGSKSIARQFGRQLAERFFASKEFHEMVSVPNRQIIVSASPYLNIPTATFAMKNYFVAKLNAKLIEFGMRPVDEVKIYRSLSYDEDYGAMTKEQRERAISGDAFYVDAAFLKDKYVIFLDDIRITGAHEGRIEYMIEHQNVECDALFMYFAELVDVTACPTLENTLNYGFVRNLLDIDWIIKNDEFIFNTRVVKYILKASQEDFIPFIRYQSDVFRETLYTCAIANSYHLTPTLKENVAYLRELTHHD